ncbi:Aspartyl protease family protein 2 [Bienertia sinuspersici]
MELTKSSSLFFSILFFLSFSLSSSLELQPFLLNSLPHPSSLHQWAQPQAQTQARFEDREEPESDSTMALHLEHVDALHPHLTAEELFSLKLTRDEARAECAYQVAYGDGSFTVGEFATETMTFRKTKVQNVAFGCGHDNEGLFVGAAGLLGLGRGKLSFPSQTGNRFGWKFSYCLVDRSASRKPSSMVFGPSAVSRKAVFTPLITNPKMDTFYYVQLVGFSVGGTRVAGISEQLFKIDNMGNGGIILDSGTSVTRLNRPAYIALRNAFRAGAHSLKSTSGFSLFDTCYDLSGKTEVRVPTVVMHFKGADVALPANNYLIPVDTSGRFCFAFAGTMSGLSIIGNIQQQGIRISFDVENARVGFLPNACT